MKSPRRIRFQAKQAQKKAERATRQAEAKKQAAWAEAIAKMQRSRNK
jgi:hypothetical protein